MVHFLMERNAGKCSTLDAESADMGAELATWDLASVVDSTRFACVCEVSS
jgi:hypothetical protein